MSLVIPHRDHIIEPNRIIRKTPGKSLQIRLPITILRHYIDRAYSAKTDNRPEFQQMIRDSGRHLFDMVIVWKLDRFSRSRYDSARYKTLLKRNGVKVVSATEAISEGAEGIILADFVSSLPVSYQRALQLKDA